MYSLHFQGLKLLDNKLTTAKLMEIITAERLDPTNLTSSLEEEVLMSTTVIWSFLTLLPYYTLLICVAFFYIDHISRVFGSTVWMC